MTGASRRVRFGVLLAAILAALAVIAAPASARPMFVSSETSTRMPVIDLASGTVSASVEGVGKGSVAVAVAPDGRRAYVASFEAGNISVVDTATDAVISTIALAPYSNLVGIAITPDGRKVYVADSSADQVVVIDTATDTVSKTIPLGPGSGPRPVAISPDGRWAYVAEDEAGEVAVIDTATDTVSKTIPLPPATAPPMALAITPDGRRLYGVGLAIGGFGLAAVTVIDTATDVVSATFSLPGESGAFGIAISPDGRWAYAPEPVGGEVAVIDTATDTVSKTIPLGLTAGIPFEVAVSPDGRRAYVTVIGTEEIAVLDTVNDEALAPIEVPGEHPLALGIVPDQPPTAALAPAAGLVGRPVTFDASASADPDGGTITYDWDFGDGTSAADAGPAPSHTYAAPGHYRATVTVADDQGCSTTFVFTGQTAYCNGSGVARATVDVPVSAPPAPPAGPSPATSPFLIRGFTVNPGNGTVRARLWLSGAGTLRVRGAKVRRVHRAVAEARVLTVVVRPTPKAMKVLRRRHRLRARVRITFEPLAAPAGTEAKTLTLRRRGGGS